MPADTPYSMFMAASSTLHLAQGKAPPPRPAHASHSSQTIPISIQSCAPDVDSCLSGGRTGHMSQSRQGRGRRGSGSWRRAS